MSALRHAGVPRQDELARIVRFCAVGASNTLLTLAAFALLVALGTPPAIASAAGFALGAANGYRWNSRGTFAAHHPTTSGTVVRYVAVQALGTGLSALGLALAGDAHLTRAVAELATLPWVTVLTYCLSRLVVFRGSTA
jgi:putative flippase GtrA